MVGSAVTGVLLMNERGVPVYAEGLGADPLLQRLAKEGEWVTAMRRKRLGTVIVNRVPQAVLLVQLAKADLYLLSDAPDAVTDFLGSVDFAYDILNHLVTDPFEAMTVVDAEARIVFISSVHERFFGLGRGEGTGRPVREVIENTRLDHVVRGGRAEIGAIQRMRGAQRVVSRVPITHDGEIVGAMGRIMFKGPEQLELLSQQINTLERQVEFYKREATALRQRRYGLESLIGESRPMQRLRSEIIKVAPLAIPVLVQGESGTGKELVAHALHLLGPRRDAAMVMVNGAGLPPTLVEAELFGYEPGSFTGADRKGRKGKFEQANGGTLFLDELGDMPLEVQAKLLRVLQDRIIERIGGDRPREVDFRLVTATNRDLQVLVSEGKFRLDLFYRVSPIVLEVPPLRERRDDIPLLAEHFMQDVAARHGRACPAIEADAMAYLMEQSWPGNVRQLRHEIERAFVFCESHCVTAADFGVRDITPAIPRRPPAPERPETLKDAIDQLEATLIQEAMRSFSGNKKRVAAKLGISRSYLYKKLGLSADDEAA